MDAVIVCMVILLVAMILLVLAPLAAAAREEAKEARERGELSQFDERQRTLRCRAALHSLVVVLIYLVVWAFLDLCGIAWAKESFVCAMLAVVPVVLAFGVWMGECILRDVAIGWNIKQENRRLPLYVLFLSNIGISFAYNFPHTRIKIVAAAFAITGASMLMLQSYADHRRKKREANVCEEE